MNLYICRTYYNIYATIIRVLAQKESADLIIDDFNEKNIQDVDELYHLIVNSNIFHHVYLFHGGYKGNQLPTTLELGCEKSDVELNLLKSIDSYIGVNNKYNKIYIYNDWDGVFGKYLRFRKLHYILSEPSKNAFQVMFKTTPNTSKFISESVAMCHHEINKAVGHSVFCDSIEVSSLVNIPNYAREKAVIINIDRLLAQLDNNNKGIIKYIFNKKVFADCYKTKSATKVLLLTRPYCGSDKWLPSADIQEQLIRDIIKDYVHDGIVFIKPHPRDGFPYERFANDSNIFVLSKSFPIEVLNIFPEIHFDMAISIGEICAENMNNVDKIIVLDLEWFKEIRKKYCSEDELEKLNPL